MSTPYPRYDVLAKWRSLSFDEVTREVLRRRLEPPAAPKYLDHDEWRTLQVVVARLIPQPERDRPIPVAAWIDARLAENGGEGYRDERMPPMRDAWRIGLAGIAAEAIRTYKRGLVWLAPEQQDAVLERVQSGAVAARAWRGMDAARFFRDDLLKTAASLYYAHPDAWSEIGFGGPASPRGYVRLGFDAADPWEAQEGP